MIKNAANHEVNGGRILDQFSGIIRTLCKLVGVNIKQYAYLLLPPLQYFSADKPCPYVPNKAGLHNRDDFLSRFGNLPFDLEGCAH